MPTGTKDCLLKFVELEGSGLNVFPVGTPWSGLGSIEVKKAHAIKGKTTKKGEIPRAWWTPLSFAPPAQRAAVQLSLTGAASDPQFLAPAGTPLAWVTRWNGQTPTFEMATERATR